MRSPTGLLSSFEVEVEDVSVIEHPEPEPFLHARGAGDRDAAGEHGEGLSHAARPERHDRVALHADLLDQVLAFLWLAEFGEPHDLYLLVVFIITVNP